MTDYTSIRVPVEAKDAASESKRDDETWAEFMQRLSDTQPDKIEVVPTEDIDARLRELEEHALNTSSRLGKIEQTLDELQAGRY
jgi:hypothetical protein